jgi:hypothetical protein
MAERRFVATEAMTPKKPVLNGNPPFRTDHSQTQYLDRDAVQFGWIIVQGRGLHQPKQLLASTLILRSLSHLGDAAVR